MSRLINRTLIGLVSLLALFLLACNEPHPQANVEVSNKDYNNDPDDSEHNVKLLFENDGCKIYRFYDKYEYRYYVHCPNEQSVTWEDQHGKHRERHESQTTN